MLSQSGSVKRLKVPDLPPRRSGGSLMKIAGLRLATAGVAAAALVTMSACSSGLGGGTSSSSGAAGGGGSQTLTLLVDNGPSTVKAAEAVTAAFEKANPGVTVKHQTRPGGTGGD